MRNSQSNLFASRREFLQTLAAAASVGGIPSVITSAAEELPPRLSIGFSLYGMKSLPVPEALKVCSEIGYECVELAVMADWPCAPEKLSVEQRRDLRQQLSDRKLELASLMENLPLAVDGEKHRDNLDRLKRAFELFRDLAPKQTPLIETILGGSPDKWPMLKDKFVERLRDWSAVAAEHKSVIAIKAHVAGALHLPQDGAEIVQTINSPSLQLAFDQSHFQLREVPLADAWKVMAQRTRFVHVKDGRGKPGAFQFLLPGDGTIDYVELFRLLKSSRYSGPVVVEVSAQLSSKPDYDPVAAAKKSWPVLRDARKAAMEN
ncbi:MAG: sugar phosphate isomerase/epimerase [Planctomycetaceae bacterium]|nr:sugar phosphate isomerase/epimerase [Planctomycetaceae bacterium]